MNGQIANALLSMCPFVISQSEGRYNLLQSNNKVRIQWLT